MKKFLSTILASAMILSVAAAAYAAPAYEGDALKNTVTGFKGGRVSWQLDLTQMGGAVKVSFDLGSNEPYLDVELEVNKGKKYIDAAFDRKSGSIVVTPDPDAPKADDKEYEIEIDVVDRKTKELIADGYFLTGFVTFDTVQPVENGRFYNNARGVVYDFGRGAKDVKINAGRGVNLVIPRTPAGIVNMQMTDERNESIDYMFSKHELEYFNFVSKPQFSEAVEVKIASDAPYLYEYAGGRLRKLNLAKHEQGEGYTFFTKQLATYILADAPLNEGVVNEQKNTVSGGASSEEEAATPAAVPSGKPNPSTGAANLS